MRRDLTLLALLLTLGLSAPALAQDPAMKDLRKRMVAEGRLTMAEMRALADSGDSLAAVRYAQRLDDLPNAAELVSDRVHYYTRAVHGGRDFAARPLVALLALDTDLPESRLRAAEAALLAAAARGHAGSALALVNLYRAGVPFGAKPEAVEALLAVAAAGDTVQAGKAAMDLALVAIGPDPQNPLDARTAHDLLTQVAQGPDLGARVLAENLLRLMPPMLRPLPRPDDLMEDRT